METITRLGVELVPEEEVLKELGLKYIGLYKLCKREGIPSVRINHKKHIALVYLQKYLLGKSI